MYEYTCPECGVTKQVRYAWEVRTYCSKKCRGKALARKYEQEREANAVSECVFQPETIMCSKRECDRCGWNPEVAKARLDALTGQGIALPMHETDVPNYKFGEWISAEEKLPKDKVQVLAFTHAGKVMSLHCKGGKWCVTSNVRITHWMPMPNPPEV